MSAGRRVAAVGRLAWRAPELKWARLSIALFGAAGLAEAAGAAQPVWMALYGTCYVAGGWQPARSGLASLRDGRLDVDVLMVIAAGAAASIGEWFDGGLLIVIFAISGGLEELATAKAERDVRSLLDLAPERATRLRPDGSEQTVAAASLQPGETVLVRAGGRVPADGRIVDGRSDLDESSITGEALPAAKEPGAEVFAGSVNGEGPLVVRVKRAAGDSVVARIVEQVEEASAAKAPTQLMVERFEARYTVAVVLGTVGLIGVPLALGHEFAMTLERAMVFMVVASPCAVVLATMPPLLSAIATASRHGVLVRGAVVMEQLAGVDTVMVDKTGTVTEGVPEVAGIHALGGWDEETLLALAAAAEQRSEHPIGRAIRAAARDAGGRHDVSEVRTLPGRGVDGWVDGRRVRVGNRSLCVDDPLRARLAGNLTAAGNTTVFVDVDGRAVGMIAVTDRLRHGARLLADRIEAVGVARCSLLTGDTPEATAPVAARLRIGEFDAGLLPDEKADRVRAAQARGRRVLVLGDGVNDAPALAAADVGAAMGGRGVDVALETADVVLVTDVITRLAGVIELVQRAQRVVRQNLVFAVGVIVALATISFTGGLDLPVAVLAHEGSTLAVALNGLRLLRADAWPDRRRCMVRPGPPRNVALPAN